MLISAAIVSFIPSPHASNCLASQALQAWENFEPGESPDHMWGPSDADSNLFPQFHPAHAFPTYISYDYSTFAEFVLMRYQNCFNIN